MSLHFGVDVDGVLALHLPAMLEIVRDVTGLDLRPEQVTDYYFRGLVERPQMEEVFVRCMASALALPPFPDHHLINDLPGRVSIVTHRHEELAGETTRAWLAMHGIRYQRLIFATGVKSEWGPFDFFIDDAPHNALELARQGSTVFLMDHAYNRSHDFAESAERIVRVRGWGEVRDHLVSQALWTAPRAC